jgi:alcohol dehydrogenase (NADP+)
MASSTTTVDYPNEFKGFSISDPSQWSNPKLTSFQPKNFGPTDVDIEIECCGVCASELFTLKNDWGHGPMACTSSKYGPKTQCVGHEIVGRVVKVGESCTTGVKLGDRVGLGAQASCCGECSRCKSGNQQYCPKMVTTYASVYPDGYVSQGGYASHVRANEILVFPIPEGIESHLVAPLQCGGLTVYSPIKRGIEDILAKGETPKVGVIGIGGLGHMAIMIAKALGAEVTAFSRSNSKKEDALKMGADKFVATAESPDFDTEYFDEFHLMLNCASSTTDLPLTKFIRVLKVNRSFTSVGLPHIDETFNVSPFAFFSNGSNLGSSALGSREEAIELFDLAVKHNFAPWVETLDVNEENVSQALTRLDKGDVRYRFTLVGFNKFFGTGKL